MLKRHGRQHLEKTGMPWKLAFFPQPLSSAVDQVVQQGEIVVADGLPVESDAFVDAYQVGRRI